MTKFYLKKVGRDWHHYDSTPPKPYSVFNSEKEMNEFLRRNGMAKATNVDNLEDTLRNEFDTLLKQDLIVHENTL